MTSRFHRLHVPGDPFVLPCAWDVASGQLFAEAGHPAIGTTSLGVAAGIGARDEDRDTREAMVGLMRSLRRALPEALLSCDFEDGYADDPQEVVEILRSAFTADHGLIVDGINIEDSSGGHLDAPEVLAAKVSAISQPCRTCSSTHGSTRSGSGGTTSARSSNASMPMLGPVLMGSSFPGPTIRRESLRSSKPARCRSMSSPVPHSHGPDSPRPASPGSAPVRCFTVRRSRRRCSPLPSSTTTARQRRRVCCPTGRSPIWVVSPPRRSRR
jgi:hypothetical protein